MPPSDRPTCFLFDNGSLRAAATRSLRGLGARLERIIDAPVRPVSLLHSSGVDPAELDGQPAELLEPALLQWARTGGREAVLLPLFFGPSGALTDYLPARLSAVQRQCPDLCVRRASWLVRPEDDSEPLLAAILADAVRAVVQRHQLRNPLVVLTDHGSPQPAVTEVRNRLGEHLRTVLQGEVATVTVASMERREGDAYAFNEPLLATALRTMPEDQRDVVVALQFLQSGRHAGPDGDVAQICAEAKRARPSLRTCLTEPIVGDPRLLDLLARRYHEALKAADAAR